MTKPTIASLQIELAEAQKSEGNLRNAVKELSERNQNQRERINQQDVTIVELGKNVAHLDAHVTELSMQNDQMRRMEMRAGGMQWEDIDRIIPPMHDHSHLHNHTHGGGGGASTVSESVVNYAGVQTR